MSSELAQAEAQPSTAAEDIVVGRRRLTGKRAALALVAGMLAVPVVPAFLALGSDDPAPSADGQTVEVATESGEVISTVPPDGWEVASLPGGVVWRSGDAFVHIEAHDLDGRDAEAVGERLMQIDRRRGFSAAYDGGQAQSGDGRLTGQTCVVTAAGMPGACAVIADDEVVVLVHTLGDVDTPAPPLQDLLAAIGRADR
ncbi:hypothetical protein C6A87_025900 [Mycobacterium sp. ITM-2016-00317]|uniref:hypothetical protein n=1 Tax=Mycobacterium sp. ITM-2016-00317 TaxID=2099694 RepID=UPI00287FD4CE|nr:hypothetical protein [Mycobacterium sp. ITM-2016-00317]WNG87168.1 hypothetical protein C6A87_025900 [Mycobacterium sp. ITM-2016-00317]